MEQIFDIHLMEKIVGKMYVSREGLYYRFRCSCDLPSSDLYTIIAINGQTQKDLGICVPQKTGFGFERKISVKCFQNDSFAFHVAVRSEGKMEEFIPICEQKPFAYITSLPMARLSLRGQAVGVVLPRTCENQLPPAGE